MASDHNCLLVTAALLGAAAMAVGQETTRAKYKVLDPPKAQAAKPEYRVTQAKGSTTVAIFAGEKSTGGYSVEVNAVDRAGDTCTVRYKIEPPDRDAMVPQVLTYPAVAIRISPACRSAKVDPLLPQGQTK